MTAPFEEETSSPTLRRSFDLLIDRRRRPVPHPPTVDFGDEVTFEGSTDPNTPIANGWLRASHRAIDPERSEPWLPYHPHERREPLVPDEFYPVDVELVPTCIVVPPSYRLALWVRGKDYEYTGDLDEYGEKFVYATRGTGGMTHADPENRPADIFGGSVTLYVGPDHPSHLLMPKI
jgi:predicted acyl esterase